MSTRVNAADKFVKGDPLGRLALTFWRLPILQIYNVTESAFFQFTIVWFAMLLVTCRNTWQNGFVATGAGATVSTRDGKLDEACDRLPVAP
jgi:hypothetical protein